MKNPYKHELRYLLRHRTYLSESLNRNYVYALYGCSNSGKTVLRGMWSDNTEILHFYQRPKVEYDTFRWFYVVWFGFTRRWVLFDEITLVNDLQGMLKERGVGRRILFFLKGIVDVYDPRTFIMKVVDTTNDKAIYCRLSEIYQLLQIKTISHKYLVDYLEKITTVPKKLVNLYREIENYYALKNSCLIQAEHSINEKLSEEHTKYLQKIEEKMGSWSSYYKNFKYSDLEHSTIKKLK